jgi:hypothetical protein
VPENNKRSWLDISPLAVAILAAPFIFIVAGVLALIAFNMSHDAEFAAAFLGVGSVVAGAALLFGMWST